MAMKAVFVMTLLALVICSWTVEARYLPTRSDSSRREDIRELLRELLEGSERHEYDKRFYVKRAADMSGAASVEDSAHYN